MNPTKPEVWMIRIKNCKLSNHYKKISSYSWKRAGFKVRYYDAVTPKTMPRYRELNFAQNRRKMMKGKYFSETEQAVWYSHYNLWHFCAFSVKPIIIAEHDAVLVNPIPESLYEEDIVSFGYSSNLSYLNDNKNTVKAPVKYLAGTAYYIKPTIASKMYEHHSNPGATKIAINCDGIVHDFVDMYGKRYNSVTPYCNNIKGRTIVHPKVEK